RLEQHRPATTEPWPPGTDHRVIQQAHGQKALHQACTDTDTFPEAITPVVAFDGRRTIIPLNIGGEPVCMTVLDGVLRAVAAELPTMRLILEGPGPSVLTLALSLAET